jgi:hypothetical protein
VLDNRRVLAGSFWCLITSKENKATSLFGVAFSYLCV